MQRCSRDRALTRPSRLSGHAPAHARPSAAAQVLQFQGDQRVNIGKFLIENQLALKEKIKTHGF